MGRPALTIVESPSFYEEEVELWNETSARESHSLHQSVAYPDSFRPELPAYFIRKYTSREEIVLDPFCGSGATALEANLLGRGAFASDANPFAVRLTEAKLCPADLAELTLRLQFLNLKRPVSLDLYEELFSQFSEPDTFREILQLRALLRESERNPSAFHARTRRVDRFIQLLVMSLLHGHSAAYLSVYTFPQISISPEEQAELNRKRNQVPQYRSVVPRILRKAAMVLRDGIPSVLQRVQLMNAVGCYDARSLTYVPNNSVDLMVTAPPLPGRPFRASDLWLRLWFAGLSQKGIQDKVTTVRSLSEWRHFMGDVLQEARRVLRPGKRAVFDLRAVPIEGEFVALDEVLASVVRERFSRQWELECVLYQRDARKSPAQLLGAVRSDGRGDARMSGAVSGPAAFAGSAPHHSTYQARQGQRSGFTGGYATSGGDSSAPLNRREHRLLVLRKR